MAVYLKSMNIFKKFRQAEEENKILFVSAPCGYGKSAAFAYYYRRRPYFSTSGRSGVLDKMPPIDSIRQSVILLDDICFLKDNRSRQYVLDMIYNGQKIVVLMGRGALPVWLVTADVELEFIRADKGDLVFSNNETKMYLEKMGYECSMELADVLTGKLGGYPLLTMFYTKNLGMEAEYSNDVYYRALREMYHYYDEVIWNVWDEKLKNTLLATCEFANYTVELIERITGYENLADMIEYAYSIGNFVTNLGDKKYQLDPILKEYVMWKRSFVYSQQDLNDLYRKAAEYYEEINDVENALEYYHKAGLDDRMLRLMTLNAEFDPARAQLFKTRKYLFALEDEQISNNPALISSASLLHSVLFSTEESEKLYNTLIEYANDEKRTPQERKDAKNRIQFLDMSLMHRLPILRIESVYKAAELMKEEKIKISEMAITGNSPSLINGGVDFSQFLKRSKRERIKLIKPLEEVYGRLGKTMYEIGVAECMIEQNNANFLDVSRMLSEAYAVADAKERMEICLVAVVLLARLHLIRGQVDVAMEQMNDFYKKIKKEDASFLLPNMHAFEAWISLLRGNTGEAKEWLKEAPNENVEFYITERYRYMHKVRVLIAAGNMEQAYSLLKRLELFYLEYHREYYRIQSNVLEAILVYRLGDERWKFILMEALDRAEEFHYVRVISDEGAAVLPLLIKLKKSVREKSFVSEVISETDKMAKMYPDYMEPEFKLQEPLTKKELEILNLIHRGKRSEEICEICNISYSGLKFHNRNIYRKLGVSSRIEAERKAVMLRIVN